MCPVSPAACCLTRKDCGCGNARQPTSDSAAHRHNGSIWSPCNTGRSMMRMGPGVGWTVHSGSPHVRNSQGRTPLFQALETRSIIGLVLAVFDSRSITGARLWRASRCSQSRDRHCVALHEGMPSILLRLEIAVGVRPSIDAAAWSGIVPASSAGDHSRLKCGMPSAYLRSRTEPHHG
jgi:hypothetical protein